MSNMSIEVETQLGSRAPSGDGGSAVPARTQAAPTDALDDIRLSKNEAARSLLREWLADDSGYDEEVWPQVKQLIEEDRLSPRKRFRDETVPWIDEAG